MIHPIAIWEVTQFPDFPLPKRLKESGGVHTDFTTSLAALLGRDDQSVELRICNYMESNRISCYLSTYGLDASVVNALCLPHYQLKTVDNEKDEHLLYMKNGMYLYELQRKLTSQLWSKTANISKGFPTPLVTGFDWGGIFQKMLHLGWLEVHVKIRRYLHNQSYIQQLQDLRFNLVKNIMDVQLIMSLTEFMDTELFTMNMHVYAKKQADAELIAGSLASDHFSVNELSCNDITKKKIMQGNFYYHTSPKGTTSPIVNNIQYILKRKEAAVMFQLPYACSEWHKTLPGVHVVQTNPFTYEGRSCTGEHNIYLGNYSSGAPYSIPIQDMLKHGVIFGKPGFGKTVTTMSVLKQLAEHNVPFLVIESAKTEYYNALTPLFKEGELKVYNFKNPYRPDFFKINPLIPLPQVSIAQHISNIKGCFMAAIPMYGATPHVFENMLYDFYKNIICQGDESLMFEQTYLEQLDAPTRSRLNMIALYEYVDVYMESSPELFTDSNDNDFSAVLKRRLAKLSENSIISHSFNPVDSPGDITELFRRPTLIELDALSDDADKALVMSVVLAYLDEYKKQGEQLVDILKREEFTPSRHAHFLFIEEAHRLLSAKKAAASGDGGTESGSQKFISLFCDLLAEIRARGTGLFLIEQSPSTLVPEVIRQCNLNISHRLTEEVDRNYIGNSMNMTPGQKKYLSVLGIGDAVVYEANLDQPVFLKVNSST